MIQIKHARTRDHGQVNAKLCGYVFMCHIMLNGDKMKVYRKAFLSLYAVTNRIIGLRSALLAGKSRHNRGKVPKAKAIKGEDVLEISWIIVLFPIKQNHYSSGTVLWMLNFPATKCINFLKIYTQTQIEIQFLSGEILTLDSGDNSTTVFTNYWEIKLR